MPLPGAAHKKYWAHLTELVFGRHIAAGIPLIAFCKFSIISISGDSYRDIILLTKPHVVVTSARVVSIKT